MEILTLDAALEGIAQAAKAVLTGATESGEVLEDVVSVVLSERARPRPELPAIYIFLATAQATTGMGLRETWVVPLTIVSLVRDDDPEAGYLTCMSMTSRARSVLMANRRLGLAYVNDLVSVTFEPAYQTQVDNRTIYGAGATVAVRFTTFEG